MSAPRAAAHLILGPREEPFLGALLTSLDGSVESVIVNDNASEPSPHAQTLAESAFAACGALVVDRTPFVDFSTARNICLRLHAERNAGSWAAFVDADEVHGDAIARIARNLDAVPDDVGYVDGYTWHFFQSPAWYTSIERRMSFFRFGPEVRWEGRVHEQLRGVNGARVALPYVYAHYGHVVTPRRHAEKGRLYSSLGQEGSIVAEDALDSIDPARYFADKWPALLLFRGEHPAAARPVLARLRTELGGQFARTDELVRASQPWT
ncbi:MAG: hypothetical protein M3R30_02890, partial [Candidatus Eremiobacteraeota bacterium]|nr:hypothetical protein [Candidatus Eremiobacteraeota bacterium]